MSASTPLQAFIASQRLLASSNAAADLEPIVLVVPPAFPAETAAVSIEQRTADDDVAIVVSDSDEPLFVPFGAAMHARLFRDMFTAETTKVFVEAQTHRVDLSAHDPELVRLVLAFLRSEFELNGAWPLQDQRKRISFQFSIEPELAFDLAHLSFYLGCDELTKLASLMFRDFLVDGRVEPDVFAALPPDFAAMVGSLFDANLLAACDKEVVEVLQQVKTF